MYVFLASDLFHSKLVCLSLDTPKLPETSPQNTERDCEVFFPLHSMIPSDGSMSVNQRTFRVLLDKVEFSDACIW